jgi:PKD repeat protein
LTSDIDIIYLNNTLGFPSFSRLDDVVTFTELDENNDEMVSAIYLEDNKISPSGDVIPLITMAKWPVFYSTGSRALGLPPTANFSVDYKNGDAPRIVRFIDASLNNPTTWEWTFPGGTPSVSNEQNPYVMYTNPGTYKVTLTVSNAYGENSITKESYIEVYPTASGRCKPEIFHFTLILQKIS